jgi:hypothetical protein
MGDFKQSRTTVPNLTVSGDLTVEGTTTTVTTTNTVISDKLLELGNGVTGTPSGDAGVIIERGSSNNAIIAWDESADGFIVGTTTATGISSGNLTIAAAPFTASSVTVTVNLDVDGVANLDNVDIDGTLDVVSTAGVSIDAVDDSNITVTASAKDLDIAVAGGGTQELRLASAGIGASAIHLNASAGGINIDSADMIDIDAADEITIDTTTADGHIAITSAHTAGESVLISANANAGSILNMDAGILDIDVQADVTIDADSVKIGNAAAGAGILHIMEDTDNGANYSGFTVGNMAENAVYTLPTADGDNGDVLKTNGSAVLAWGAAGSAAAVAADDIDAGDAAVGISTTSGAITIDSNASSVTVDGHTGVTVQSSNSGNITLDSVADVILDADGDQITMKFGGATGQIDFTNENSGDGVIQQKVDAKDLVIKQFDGTEVARFTDGGNVEIKNDLYLKSDDCVIHFGLNSDIILDHRPDSGLRIQQATETTGEPTLSLKNTGNFASGPGIHFAMDNTSGEGDGDILGFMKFFGSDSANVVQAFATIEVQSVDVTDGTEDGGIIFKTLVAGSDTNLLDINNTLDGGVAVANGLSVGGTLGVTGLVTMKPGSNTAQLKLEQDNVTDGWSIFASSANGFLEFTRIGSHSGLKISMEHNGGHFGIRSDAAAIKLGVDADVTLTHVHDTGLILNSSRQLQFGDSATHIKQISDSNLEIEADGSIILDSPVVDFQDDGVILKFGDDSEVTLTHVHDTGLLLSDASGIGTTKLMFGDAACFIQQQADGQLGIDADSIINVTAPTLDIDASTAVTIDTAAATITASGLITVAGETLFEAPVTISSVAPTAAGGGFNITGATLTNVANVNGEIITTILVDLTGLHNDGGIKDVIGENGVAAAYITKITSAVNGFVYKAEMNCVETPASSGTTQVDIDLVGNTASLTQGADYDSGTSKLIIDSDGDFAVGRYSDSLPSGTLTSGLHNYYLYLAAGHATGDDAEFTAGRFIIKLYGCVVA